MRRKTFKAKRSSEEYVAQVHVVRWLMIQYPDVLFCATLGGVRVGIGLARKLKMQGYQAGIPDLVIYEPRKGYHGLMIEMKKEIGGVVSDSQMCWGRELISRNYKFEICHGEDQAMKVIKEYLE